MQSPEELAREHIDNLLASCARISRVSISTIDSSGSRVNSQILNFNVVG